MNDVVALARQPPWEQPVAWEMFVLQLRDAPTKMVFELLQRETGINFILDKDVKSDSKTTIFVQDVPVDQALDLVLDQSQLARQILASNMVMIYPNTPNKQKEYEQQIVGLFADYTLRKQERNLVDYDDLLLFWATMLEASPALGARMAQVTTAFVRSGLILSAIGCGCGLAAALVLAPFMKSLLFSVSPSDPLTYAAMSASLISAAALASSPGRRCRRPTPTP